MKYLTSFYTGYQLQNSNKMLNSIIDWLFLTGVFSKLKIRINLVKKWRRQNKDILLKMNKDEIKRLILDQEVEEFRIFAGDIKSLNYNFHLFFQFTRSNYVPEHKVLINNDSSEIAEDHDSPRFIALSIENALFGNKLKLEEFILFNWNFFCESELTYGFIDYTDSVIANPFQLVSSSKSGQMRLSDVNYLRQIEGVHPWNFLSELHMKKLDNCKVRLNELDIKYIDNNILGERKCLLKQKKDSLNNTCDISVLLPPDKFEDREYFMLIKQEQLRYTASGKIDSVLPTNETMVLPPNVFLCKETLPKNNAEAAEHTRQLQNFYNNMVLRKKRNTVQEAIVEYTNPFLPNRIVRRIITNFENTYCKVVSNQNISKNELIFVVTKSIDLNKCVEIINNLINSWTTIIKQFSSVYGDISVCAVRYEIKPNAVLFYVKICSIKPETFDYLVTIIDQVNDDEFLIKYLIVE